MGTVFHADRVAAQAGKRNSLRENKIPHLLTALQGRQPDLRSFLTGRVSRIDNVIVLGQIMWIGASSLHKPGLPGQFGQCLNLGWRQEVFYLQKHADQYSSSRDPLIRVAVPRARAPVMFRLK